MKNVNNQIKAMLDSESSFASCDLYSLTLCTGETYYFADYDEDIIIANKVYKHDALTFKRGQLKLQGMPSVDSLTVTIYCVNEDKVAGESFMQACHAGKISASTLMLSKAYFLEDECIGSVDIFSGNCEVESAGGLAVQLKVKSEIQGLSAPIPVRMFAAQAAYATNNGVVATSSRDTTSMLIPLKPSGKVLRNG